MKIVKKMKIKQVEAPDKVAGREAVSRGTEVIDEQMKFAESGDVTGLFPVPGDAESELEETAEVGEKTADESGAAGENKVVHSDKK